MKTSAQSNSQPQWELQITTPVYQEAQIQFTSGSAMFGTAPALGFEVNFFRRFFVGKHSAFIAQIGIGRMAYKLEYEFLKTVYPEIPFSLTKESHSNRVYNLRRFALGYEYSRLLREKYTGAISLSLGFRQSTSTFSDFSVSILNPDGSLFPIVVLETQSTHLLLTPDSELRIGICYSIGKRLHISATAFARYSFMEQANGSFVIFPNTPSRTTGTFSLSGSCAGLSIGIGI